MLPASSSAPAGEPNASGRPAEVGQGEHGPAQAGDAGRLPGTHRLGRQAGVAVLPGRVSGLSGAEVAGRWRRQRCRPQPEQGGMEVGVRAMPPRVAAGHIRGGSVLKPGRCVGACGPTLAYSAGVRRSVLFLARLWWCAVSWLAGVVTSRFFAHAAALLG